ncbi:hypothetical protein OHV71_12815 [Acinetobacter baumannii]|nr:hypothetical protein [Acinetobacter baumannii]
MTVQHTWFRFVIWWDEVISVAPKCFLRARQMVGFFVFCDIYLSPIIKGIIMSLLYIGVTTESVKAGRQEYFEYAIVASNGAIRPIRDINMATKFKTEEEVIEAIKRTSFWVAEYDGENVNPLQPTR